MSYILANFEAHRLNFHVTTWLVTSHNGRGLAYKPLHKTPDIDANGMTTLLICLSPNFVRM